MTNWTELKDRRMIPVFGSNELAVLWITYNRGPHMTAVGISLREEESRSSNSFNFQNTNNFKRPFPWVLRCYLRLRMSATSAVLIELCQVSSNSSLSSLACLAFLRRRTIEY